MVYLDNAATTLNKPQCVVDAVCEAICTLGNAGRGVNEASLKSLRMVSETRELIANLFGFDSPNRVCFTCNATEALNTAIMGCFKQGNHVITTAVEHNSVLRPLFFLEEQGVIELTILPVDEYGRISKDDFKSAIKPATRALVIGHASNVTGNVVDLEEIGLICKENGILLIVDAAQTAGIVPINMNSMNISVLCFTGHKGLLGPQGTGGIVVSNNVEIQPLKHGGSGIHSYDRRHPSVYPEHLEAGTLNVHGIAGLNAALKYLNQYGQEEIAKKELELLNGFVDGVRNISNVRLIGDFRRLDSITYHTGVVSLNIGDYDAAEVCDELMNRFEIATRGGAHCAPLTHETFGTKGQGAVRFSFSHRNTMDEIRYAVEAVRKLATE